MKKGPGKKFPRVFYEIARVQGLDYHLKKNLTRFLLNLKYKNIIMIELPPGMHHFIHTLKVIESASESRSFYPLTRKINGLHKPQGATTPFGIDIRLLNHIISISSFYMFVQSRMKTITNDYKTVLRGKYTLIRTTH